MGKGFKIDFDVKGLENFQNDIRKQVKDAALNASYDYECPKCHTEFKAKVGKNICPNCGIEINLKPDSSWDKL